MEINYDLLRRNINIYLCMSAYYNPNIQVDIIKLQKCSNEELLEFADKYEFDVTQYYVNVVSKSR